MGTSNWQHISYCCEILYTLAPKSVLDVGVGFGRWGMLARDVCDVWRKNVFPEQWKVEVVGIEAFERLVQPYHAVFYSKVLIGDGLVLLKQMERTFDVVILGDVLEHFARDQAEELLRLAREKAYYVMLCVPLGTGWAQGELYGNPHERHQSEWQHGDLARLGPVCHRFFRDFVGRCHAVYLFPSTRLDTASYWRGRRHDLIVPTYRDVGRLHPKPPRKSLGQVARENLARFPRIEAVVRSVYRAARSPRGLLPALRRELSHHPYAEFVARKAYRALKGARGAVTGAPSPLEPPVRPAVLKWEIGDAAAPVLAVVHPESFGVTTSTRNNFPNLVFCRPEQEPERAAREMLEKDFPTIVLSDVFPSFDMIARKVKRRRPGTRLLVHYHGSFAQNTEPGIRAHLRAAVDLVRDGVVERIGCAKAGMAEALRAMGVEAVYLPYRVRPPGQVMHHGARSPRRLGVFVRDILRKNAHTQYVAAGMVRDAEVHVNEPPDLSYLPAAPRIVPHGELPYERFLEVLGEMDLNFYVSLSECYPMVVVESLIRGVPCLTSRTHEIFEHDAGLGRTLIVEAHDNPVAIAAQAEAVLADREAVGRRCEAYALELNARAEAALNEFVGFDLYPGRAHAVGPQVRSRGDGGGG